MFFLKSEWFWWIITIIAIKEASTQSIIIIIVSFTPHCGDFVSKNNNSLYACELGAAAAKHKNDTTIFGARIRSTHTQQRKWFFFILVAYCAPMMANLATITIIASDSK